MEEIDEALAFRHLYDFVAYMWPALEAALYVPARHIKVICQHLEAVTRGEIKRLLIMLPPRFSKSLLTCVFWPAWEWLHRPSTPWLTSSYAESLSMRDSVRCRRLIQSEKYQRLLMHYQPDLVLTGDQNTKGRFENSLGGVRLATSVGGSNTGEGGGRVVVDDPHNVVKVESDAVRAGTLAWWDEAMSTRLNDPGEGAYVVDMHRSHEHDLAGHILDKMAQPDGRPWVVICLPMRYEGQDRSLNSPFGTVDWRTEQGELLWPNRFPEDVVRGMESDMGIYAASAQFQQRPAPREGGMFKTERFKFCRSVEKTQIVHSVRYWDKAATEGGHGACTAGVLMHKLSSGAYVVGDVARGRWSIYQREQTILSMAQRDAASNPLDRPPKIFTEQEPGSGGKESALSTIKNLSGFPVYADVVGGNAGNKVTRAESYSAQVEAGNVWLVAAPWNDEFVREHGAFPYGGTKDQVDAAAGAFNQITKSARKEAGTW